MHGPGSNQVTVRLNGEFTGVDEWPMSFEVIDGSNAYWAIDGDYTNPPFLVLTFEYDTGAATSWWVPVPAVWRFADEQPLEEPFSGEIG